jgi:transcriptional antiterminator RfaH
LGFRSFVPKLRRTVRHARRLRDTLKPLFPGYIFIIIDLSKHRWRSINGTLGVGSLIMGAEQPTPVPPGVVEALVALGENCAVVRLDDGLEIGQKVRILSGPFAETLCRLARLDDRGRVHVLLEIMGMEVAARLDRSSIAPAA